MSADNVGEIRGPTETTRRSFHANSLICSGQTGAAGVAILTYSNVPVQQLMLSDIRSCHIKIGTCPQKLEGSSTVSCLIVSRFLV